jgi:hypothetical protein
MKTVVARGAALRALSIEIGRADEPWNHRERYHRVVIGSVKPDSGSPRPDSGSRVFEQITSVHELSSDETITRHRGEFWLARILPGLKEADFSGLRGLASKAASTDARAQVDLEVDRACLVPVQPLGRGATRIEWTVKGDLLKVFAAGNSTPETIRLSDDGSYA